MNEKLKHNNSSNDSSTNILQRSNSVPPSTQTAVKQSKGRGRRYSIVVNKRRPSVSLRYGARNIPNENRLFLHSVKKRGVLPRGPKEESSDDDDYQSDRVSTISNTSSLDSLAELQERIKQISKARKASINSGTLAFKKQLAYQKSVSNDCKDDVINAQEIGQLQESGLKNNVVLTSGKKLPIQIKRTTSGLQRKHNLKEQNGKEQRKFVSEGDFQSNRFKSTEIRKYSGFDNNTNLLSLKDRESGILMRLVEKSLQEEQLGKPGVKDFDVNSYQHRKSLRRGSLIPTQSNIKTTSGDLTNKRRSSLAVTFNRSTRSRRQSQAFKFDDDVTESNTTEAWVRRRTRQEASLAKDFQVVIERQLQRRALAKERFQRAGRIIKICVKLCLWSLMKSASEKISYMPVTHFAGQGALMFDPDYFKAQRQQRLSEEAKVILKKASDERSEKELRYIQIALRNIRSFAAYPIRMQKRLCKVGWLEERSSKMKNYQLFDDFGRCEIYHPTQLKQGSTTSKYGAGRAIVRQGHPPSTFYFILCGTLVVTVLNIAEGKKTPRAVAYLNRGDSFGELAILNNTKRASTVITEADVQLLCISVEDYEDIFMVSGGIKHVNDPDQHTFFMSLRFLQHWPINILQNHPKECLFHFFKAGDVLVKESSFSSWIYIIKSGSCSVFTKLKRSSVSKPLRKQKKTAAQIWHKGSAVVIEEKSAPVTTRRKIRPHSSVTYKESSSSLIKEGESLVKDRRTKSAIVKSRANSIPTPIQQTKPKSNIPDDMVLSRRRGSTVPSQMPLSVHDLQKLANISAMRRQSTQLEVPVTQKGVSFDFTIEESEEDEDDNEEEFVEQRRTFHSDLDTTAGPILQAEEDSVFVVVQVLQKGDVFGLQDIVYSDQPNLSLVSNGAECIMIRKHFYLEYAEEDTLRILRKETIPYPSQDELQCYLQQKLDWDAYRHMTLSATVYESRASKVQRLRTDSIR